MHAEFAKGNWMHFKVEMTVRLRSPLEVFDDIEYDAGDDDLKATGYMILMGVNADDVASAAKHAQEVALWPKDEEGRRVAYDGYVEEAEFEAVQKEYWDEEILAGAKNIDNPGVYVSTGLTFFNHNAREEAEAGGSCGDS